MKILIIRFSSIGDIVLTTPVIRCLKTQLNEVEIHFLTKRKFLDVIKANKYIDRVHCIDESLKEIRKMLRNEHFDIVIDLHNNLRSKQAKQICKAKKSSTFKKLNLKKWVFVQFKRNRMPNVHIVDRYLDAAKFTGITNDGKGLDYFIPASDRVNPVDLDAKLNHSYIALVLGGSYFTKRIPLGVLKEICIMCKRPIVLLGATEDYQIGEQLTSLFPEHLINLAGKLSLNQSASIIEQSEWVLTSDTGLMHIASAFKKNIYSFWGNTVPEFGMSPYMPGKESVLMEVKELKCRPCSKLGFNKCPKGHFKCMNTINLSPLKQVNQF